MRAIQVRNLVKEFPTGFRQAPLRILNDVTFDLEKGEHVAITGPNGCGKTTLLKTLATIYLPDEGTIRVFEQDLFARRERARKAISFVSPSLNFQAKLTLSQTVRFFASVLQRPPETVIPFLKRTGLYGMWGRRLESFSEGQKAMLRLAIGFLKQPRILLLDAGVANLDVQRREQIIQIIEEMEEFHDLTLVLVDHDPHVVDRLCNKVLVLREGGTVHSFSSVKELMSQVSYRYSVDVTLKRDIPQEQAEAIGSPMRRYELRLRYFAHDRREAEALTTRLLVLGDPVQEFTIAPVSLRDVYYLMMEGQLARRRS